MADATRGRLLEDEADLSQAFAALDTLSGAALNKSTQPHIAESVDVDARSHGAPDATPVVAGDDERLDFFITRDGETFAGTHLIVDVWDATHLDDPAYVERALVGAARKAGATVLSADFHHFQPNGGVSGVVVLAESHISIHTWPERNFAALDVFMCGDARPQDAVPVFREAFEAGRVTVSELRRGVTEPATGPATEAVGFSSAANDRP